MKCPRCESSVLDERERDGVTIDVCQQCRGIWLDRGELERILARAVTEQEALETHSDRSRDCDERGHHVGKERHDDHHGHDDRRGLDGRGRKRRWFESLTDVFD